MEKNYSEKGRINWVPITNGRRPLFYMFETDSVWRYSTFNWSVVYQIPQLLWQPIREKVQITKSQWELKVQWSKPSQAGKSEVTKSWLVLNCLHLNVRDCACLCKIVGDFSRQITKWSQTKPVRTTLLLTLNLKSLKNTNLPPGMSCTLWWNINPKAC